jgi:hypothetical protein
MKIKLTIAFIFGMAGPLLACKCNGPGTVKESFDITPVIISGQVIKREIVSFAETIQSDKIEEIERNLKSDPQSLKLFRADLVFKIQLVVKETFKGLNIPDTVTIYTTITTASCGYKFEEGKDYIIYGSMECIYSFWLAEKDRKRNIGKEHTYWTDHCTRTRLYDGSEAEELRTLKGKK